LCFHCFTLLMFCSEDTGSKRIYRQSCTLPRMDEFIKFDDRILWHQTIERRRKVVLYFNPSIKIEKEKDPLS
jgi:hypothetical protein